MTEVNDARVLVDAAPERDTFLDAVRAVATARVILWHATGLAVVSYLVSAIPAMFFVAGSLFAASARRRRPGAVVADRIRRLVPPLWAFSAIVWLVTALRAPAGRVDTSSWRWLLWFVPLWDPPGNGWEAGWLSSPLWFLRALLWLLISAPLVLAVVRRRPRLALGLAVAVVLGTDLARRSATVFSLLPAPLWWSIGDFALYGIFFGAGMAHREGAFAVSARRLRLLAALAAAGAALWASTQPVPRGVVNNAHPLHLLVGAAWLFLALSGRDRIAAAASHRVVAPVVRFASRRSMTIYVWHTTAILAALWLLDLVRPSVGRSVLYGVVIVAGTVVAAAAFGWFEDLGARRRGVLWPLASGEARWNGARRWQVSAAVGLVVVFVAASSTPAPRVEEVAAMRRPPIPSQQPPAPRFDVPGVRGVVAEPIPAAEVAASLVALTEEWRARNGIDAVSVGVRLGQGETWVEASGTRPDNGEPATADDLLDIMSATKLFTTSLVLRAADVGLVDLDAPLPPLEAVPEFPYGDLLTPMMLLTHRSGLVNYRDTPTYLADPSQVDSAAAAVRAVGQVPLTMAPGEREDYSSSNFLVLGLLLEQVTGRSFEELFAHGVLEQLGLVRATTLPSEAGEPRQATAGLLIPMDELLKATEIVLTDNDGVSASMHERRVRLDPASGSGAGSYGYCPCTLDDNGEATFFGIGYTGGHTWVAHVPSLGVTVGIDVYDTIWVDDRWNALLELYQQLADLAARIELPPTAR